MKQHNYLTHTIDMTINQCIKGNGEIDKREWVRDHM